MSTDDPDFQTLSKLIKAFGLEVIHGEFVRRDGETVSYTVRVADPDKMAIQAGKAIKARNRA